MNKEQLQQKIAEYFGRLPKEAQDVFSSMQWMETLKNIGIKFNLNPDQIEVLGTETTLVLLGITHIEEYQNLLETELKLPQEVTEKIIIEIDETILKSIKVQLAEAFETNAMSLMEEKYGGEKKLDDRFASLPKEVQIAISESDYQNTLYAIASKYKLTIEQMGILEEITTKVMLGIIHPDKYEEELSYKLNIQNEEVSNIVKDVNEEILKTIREVLKRHWDTDEKEKLADEDIPLPPYANIETKKVETITPPSTYASNFIVNIKKREEVKTPEPVVPVSVATPNIKEDEVPIPPKIDMANIQKNIIEEKLKGATVSEHTISTHTEPGLDIPLSTTVKADTETAGKNPHDPYREII